jgi:hypothetical protein
MPQNIEQWIDLYIKNFTEWTVFGIIILLLVLFAFGVLVGYIIWEKDIFPGLKDLDRKDSQDDSELT